MRMFVGGEGDGLYFMTGPNSYNEHAVAALDCECDCHCAQRACTMPAPGVQAGPHPLPAAGRPAGPAFLLFFSSLPLFSHPSWSLPGRPFLQLCLTKQPRRVSSWCW